MKNRFLLTNLVLTGVLVFGQVANAASDPAKPEAALRKAFPQLAFDSIQPSEIPGLYEVVSGQNILYFYPDKEYILAGEIYTKDRLSLTAEKRKQLSERLIKDLPLEKAVKMGSGKNVVIEFTDPDCPYCRKASEFLKMQTGVTRYVFFAPFAHPAAIEKVHYILNAADKAQAYSEMMEKGLPLPAPVQNEAIKALAQEHIALARKLGVQGTPTFFINGKMVVGADTKQIEQLLKEGAK
ncbi:DsbC family protein [Geobacter sp. DSM 9736]|uniref:DsbC family protein n=1 Tax=Geobacter sp. DSM 9736 TaxID=1277350 RepID=UPI000B511157|nr:DsbC family protein [Geobacter sp. DSM 9736]SNB45575.1 thiol:disulfide interchange protein DsbC [Geobacter sp. DSM 9736]